MWEDLASSPAFLSFCISDVNFVIILQMIFLAHDGYVMPCCLRERETSKDVSIILSAKTIICGRSWELILLDSDFVFLVVLCSSKILYVWW